MPPPIARAPTQPTRLRAPAHPPGHGECGDGDDEYGDGEDEYSDGDKDRQSDDGPHLFYLASSYRWQSLAPSEPGATYDKTRSS